MLRAVAIYRMGNRSGAKIRGKWERNWKMAPGLKRPKMATEMEKWPQKWDFGHFFSIFAISVAIFRPFQAEGHFPISFPFSPDFCAGPVSHSVDGHRTRNLNVYGVFLFPDNSPKQKTVCHDLSPMVLLSGWSLHSNFLETKEGSQNFPLPFVSLPKAGGLIHRWHACVLHGTLHCSPPPLACVILKPRRPR